MNNNTNNNNNNDDDDDYDKILYEKNYFQNIARISILYLHVLVATILLQELKKEESLVCERQNNCSVPLYLRNYSLRHRAVARIGAAELPDCRAHIRTKKKETAPKYI